MRFSQRHGYTKLPESLGPEATCNQLQWESLPDWVVRRTVCLEILLEDGI